MVIMANSIARGHVRTTATVVESRNMAAILQIIGRQSDGLLVDRDMKKLNSERLTVRRLTCPLALSRV